MDIERKGVTLNELMSDNRRLVAKVEALEAELRTSRAENRRLLSTLSSIRFRIAEVMK